MVRVRLVPNIAVMHLNNSDWNCEPRSVVTVDGAPKVDTQRLIKARATVSAVISGIGIASGQRVNRSMHVRRYLLLLDTGRGPTMSRWMWSKRASGLAKVPIGAFVCR